MPGPDPSTRPLPPLCFERRCLPKVWGGRRLESALGLSLPPAQPIGETWELSDRDEQPSIVRNGELRGTRLRDLVQQRGRELLGRTRPTSRGRFPLLVKFLDATHALSLQVHPRSTRTEAGEEKKTEAWVFLEARPDSRIWLGLKDGVGREEVAAAAGTREVVPLVRTWPARAGECVLVHGGTVHAIGAGIVLLEVQENSDTAHRLYDWDRPGLDGRPRPVQVDAALRDIAWDQAVEPPRGPQWRAIPGGRRAALVDCEAFSMESVEVETRLPGDTGGLAQVLVVLSGAGRLASGPATVDLRPGDVWLLPASLGPYHLESAGGRLSTVRIGTKP